MSTVVIEDQPEPQPRVTRTTIVEKEEPAAPRDTVVNVGEGTTVVVQDDED